VKVILTLKNLQVMKKCKHSDKITEVTLGRGKICYGHNLHKYTCLLFCYDDLYHPASFINDLLTCMESKKFKRTPPCLDIQCFPRYIALPFKTSIQKIV